MPAAEATRLGYSRIVVPRGSKGSLPRSGNGIEGPRVTEVHHLEDALGQLRHLAAVSR